MRRRKRGGRACEGSMRVAVVAAVAAVAGGAAAAAAAFAGEGMLERQ